MATGQIGEARAAYEAGEWERARLGFGEVEGRGVELDGEDLERLGNAELLGGRESYASLERAFEWYQARGRAHDAARVAVDLCSAAAMRGNFGMASAWVRQAERVLEGQPEGFGHAHLFGILGFMNVMQGKIAQALELVERALAVARRHRDADSEALALNRRARVLMRLGRIDEARADLDEAMLLVHRGRVRLVPGAMIYCNTIDACRDMSDYERALEWTEAATAWIEQRNVWCFPGICRVHRAELLRMQGEHERADQEARAALGLFERLRVRYGMGAAFAELGNLRLEVGDLDGADEAFASAHALGEDALPGAAILRMRRGDAAGARAMLETAVDERGENKLGRAGMLPALVEACVEIGDLERARAAAAELSEIASSIGTVGLRASAATASARVHLAEGDARAALTAATAAKRAWNLVGARYELIRARELLGRAYASAGDGVRAKLEADAATAARSALGSGSAGPAGAGTDPAETLPLRDADARPLSSATPIREGAVIDEKIEVGAVLGVGGMGIVHAGRHRITGRAVAIKVLKASGCGDDRQCARFLDEARACGRVRHANVVDIYDAGYWGEDPYIVMERLEGQSLADRLRDGARLDVEDALLIALQAARGVAAAHAAGIIHRDLKPANIFLGRDERGEPLVKVLDFGLSKLEEGGRTGAGELLGTPFYMAPEQIDAPSDVDERTDVHALGAVLFEMLAGRPPFVADSIPALLLAITDPRRPDLAAHRAEAPAAVSQLVARALARDPAGRFASAQALADAIERVQGGC